MTAGVVAAVLAAGTAGVRARNEVWRNEETLWRDVTVKSPRNGRGWMNYAVALMERGDYAGAAASLDRGLPLSPNYSLLEVNLGVALGHLGRAADAERHFLRAVALAPFDWRSHLHYARWLGAARRYPDALAHARLARELNPADPEAAALESSFAAADGTAEYFLSRSLAEYRMGRFRECVASAGRAIALRPDYAEAFNNVAAGHIALGEWDAGFAAAREAVRLAPSLAVARNNLEIARRRAR